ALEKLKIKDIDKLKKYSLPKYKKSIKQIFNNSNMQIVKALSYSEPVKKYKYPKNFIIFVVNKDFGISTYIGEKNIFYKSKEFKKKSGKNIFI
ncbi:unnamed protein product, partial [marine sediment metagenome]